MTNRFTELVKVLATPFYDEKWAEAPEFDYTSTAALPFDRRG